MDLGIAGKWALVCGASKGLGRGCAEALVREGVNLVVNARNADELQRTAAHLIAEGADAAGARGQNTSKPQVLAVAADITTPEGRAAAFGVAGGPGRNFDIVVTNAGGPPPGDFRGWDREAWISAVDANMLTPIELIRATVDGMAGRGFGRIVNITSSAVKAPIDILGLSNGARSGLTGFVAGVARSAIAARGVTLNNLLPGKFDTDRLAGTISAAAAKAGRSVDDVRRAQQEAIPAGRYGTPQEFGAICAFLCSVHAGYITGQNILADGGAYPGSF
ncbi:SDR family oxidoreductase [Alicycliphilus sp. T452]